MQKCANVAISNRIYCNGCKKQVSVCNNQDQNLKQLTVINNNKIAPSRVSVEDVAAFLPGEEVLLFSPTFYILVKEHAYLATSHGCTTVIITVTSCYCLQGPHRNTYRSCARGF